MESSNHPHQQDQEGRQVMGVEFVSLFQFSKQTAVKGKVFN